MKIKNTKTLVCSVALLALTAGLIPAASASVEPGKFQVTAVDGDNFTATVGEIETVGNPGTGPTEPEVPVEPEPEPEPTTPPLSPEEQAEQDAIEEWGDSCSTLPETRKSWSSIAGGNGRFASFDGDKGAYSIDGCNWTATALAGNINPGEIGYANGIFFTPHNTETQGNSLYPHISSVNGGDTWSGVANAYNAGGKFVAATPNSFLTNPIYRTTVLEFPSYKERKSVSYYVSEYAITTGANNKKTVANSVQNGRRTFWTPLNGLAASPTSGVVVVAESGTGATTNYMQDPVDRNIKTVAAAGQYSVGIHARVNGTWQDNVLPGSWKSVNWVGNQFFAVSIDGSKIATSTDGVNWTQSSTDLGAGFTKVVRSSSGEYMALKAGAVPTESNKVFATSKDGVKWTQFNLDPTKKWSDIASENGCFVALSGTANESISTCK